MSDVVRVNATLSSSAKLPGNAVNVDKKAQIDPLRLWRNQPVANGKAYKLCDVMEAELLHDISTMGLYCLDA